MSSPFYYIFNIKYLKKSIIYNTFSSIDELRNYYNKRYKKLQSVGTIDLKPVRKITYKSYKELLKQEALSSLAAE